MAQAGLTRVVVAGLVSVCSLAGAVYFGTRVLHSPSEPAPAGSPVSVVVTVETSQIVDVSPELPPGSRIVGEPQRALVSRTTTIKINYLSPLDVNTTADIE